MVTLRMFVEFVRTTGWLLGANTEGMIAEAEKQTANLGGTPILVADVVEKVLGPELAKRLFDEMLNSASLGRGLRDVDEGRGYEPSDPFLTVRRIETSKPACHAG